MTQFPKFCSMCGAPLEKCTPRDDHRERLTCSCCGFILYENPRILVCCIATWQDKALWIKRGIAPQKGLWAQPSGFMEKGETPEQAASRELYEETGAVIAPQRLNLFMVGSLPEISEVYLVYRGVLDAPEYAPSAEAELVELFGEDEVPWHQLAYPEVIEAPLQFYRDHAQRNYGVYSGVYLDGSNIFKRVTSAEPL